MSRRPGRVRSCTKAEARDRLREAQSYLLLADTANTGSAIDSDLSMRNAGVGNAVLAAIAAADVVCCVTLGERSRDQDHRAAVELIRQSRPGSGSAKQRSQRSTRLAADLETVLDAKDDSHYGYTLMTAARASKVMRAATRLVDAAREALEEA